jgi:hypothetical protein
MALEEISLVWRKYPQRQLYFLLELLDIQTGSQVACKSISKSTEERIYMPLPKRRECQKCLTYFTLSNVATQ